MLSVQSRNSGYAPNDAFLCQIQTDASVSIRLSRGFGLGSAIISAAPQSLVARLEEFPRSSIEYGGGQQVVQYREQIMPLISLSEVLADERLRLTAPAQPEQQGGDTIQVIVYTKDDRSIGLVVDRIMDVVEETLVLQRTGIRPGVIGSAVIDKKVTEILDMDGLIRTALPEVGQATAKAA